MAPVKDIVCDYRTALGILNNADECSSMMELCSNHGVSLREFELSLLKHNLPFPKFYTPLERNIQETYDAYKKSGWTTAQLAKHYGISGSTLRYYLLKLNLIATPRRSKDEIEDLIYYIRTRGGAVIPALNAIGSRIEPHKAEALLIGAGFDYIAFEFAWKRFGNWEVQPARPRVKNSKAFNVYVRCLECGVYEWRSYNSLVVGQSKRCRSCARKHIKHIPVLDRNTGKEFKDTTTAAKHFTKEAGVSVTLIQNHLRNHGFYKEGSIDLVVSNFDESTHHLFVPAVEDEVAFGSRLLVKPFPNADTSVGEHMKQDGLLELAKLEAEQAQATH